MQSEGFPAQNVKGQRKEEDGGTKGEFGIFKSSGEGGWEGEQDRYENRRFIKSPNRVGCAKKSKGVSEDRLGILLI